MSPCSASDLHSRVHPRVYALGNQASTIACLFLKSETLYVFPFDACSVKSGAILPTFRSTAADRCPLDARATRQIVSTVTALIAPPDRDRALRSSVRNHLGCRVATSGFDVTVEARGRIGPVLRRPDRRRPRKPCRRGSSGGRGSRGAHACR